MALDSKDVAELEKTQDEIYSRLARRYGLKKGEIAKLALKRYGDGEMMSDKTEEVLSDLRAMTRGGGGGSAMDKMMMWEMIRDMRAQRNNPPSPQNYQQQPPQQLQQQPEKMGIQDMMMYPMMMMMIKSMSGGEDDIMKIYKMKMLMDGEDGKGMKLEKLEQMMAEERAQTDARIEGMMSTILGKQETEKMREREERRWREMEQRVQAAEYRAQHPLTPQDPYQSTKERMDESLGMMTDMKRKMEDMGMVERPQSVEDKDFTKDMTHLKHQQTIETKAVDKLAGAADKLSTTVDNVANKVIDLTAEEQKVRQRQMDLATPEERARLQAQYETLGNQVMQEQLQEPEMGQEQEDDYEVPESDDVDFTGADDLETEE